MRLLRCFPLHVHVVAMWQEKKLTQQMQATWGETPWSLPWGPRRAHSGIEEGAEVGVVGGEGEEPVVRGRGVVQGRALVLRAPLSGGPTVEGGPKADPGLWPDSGR